MRCPTGRHPTSSIMSTEAQFAKAVETIQNLPKVRCLYLHQDGPAKVKTADQIRIYGLYKQATVGDINTSRPGLLDPAGRYKWDAWEKMKGKSQEDAKKEYVELFFELLEPYKGTFFCCLHRRHGVRQAARRCQERCINFRSCTLKHAGIV